MRIKICWFALWVAKASQMAEASLISEATELKGTDFQIRNRGEKL